jgi:uncharacterized protein
MKRLFVILGQKSSMRKLVVTSLMIGVVLSGSAGESWSADYQKGLTAYKSGDYATALHEWAPLANQGNADAQNHLGWMYDNGRGVPKDDKIAVRWYTLAAKQGDAYSQSRLGFMYTTGQGVPSNRKTAQMWYMLAAKQIESDALVMTLLDIDAKKAWDAVTLPTVTLEKSSPSSPSVNEKELQRLRRENARLKRNNQSKRKQAAKRPPPKSSPPSKSGSSGSGFFVSKLGHIITNAHVVRNCGSITVGESVKKQVATTLLETDKRNDLALLKISSTQMASVETKSLISKPGLKLVPNASEGLLRSEDVELGEDVLVSGYPYGDIYSNTIKVTKGIVSANRGIGDDTGQFQMDAAVQPGNSGGPIYDGHGNIVGVVVAQLNKLKFAKAIGSLPENVNFGIKASTVRQFLTSSGLSTKWSNRSHIMPTKELAKIAKNQTVMVVCHP